MSPSHLFFPTHEKLKEKKHKNTSTEKIEIVGPNHQKFKLYFENVASENIKREIMYLGMGRSIRKPLDAERTRRRTAKQQSAKRMTVCIT